MDEFGDLAWSPDSKWLAYTELGDNLFRRVMLYSLATGKSTPVTTDRYDSFSPAFSPDGKWLYLLSERNLKTVIKEPVGDLPARAIPGQKDKGLPPPAHPRPAVAVHAADRSGRGRQRREEGGKEGREEAGRDRRSRRHRRPTHAGASAPGTYQSLVVTEKAIFWLSLPAGEDKKGTVEGVAIGHDDPEVKPIAEKVTRLEVSADGKKLLIGKEKELYLADAVVEKPDEKKTKVDLNGWSFVVNPREEWRQMFAEAWRLERDYFYDRGMHGLDWSAVRRKYEPLLPRVTDRDELADLMAQMVSELSALHIFVAAGDVRKGPDDVAPGRLGAALVRDAKTGGHRVERVYRHDPDEPERASPLARPGVNVKAGDVILSVDGQPTLAVADVGELLRRKADKQVLLVVKPTTGEPRKVIVKPLSVKGDNDLRYHEWEYARRRLTDDLGGGDIGYVHLRAMGGDDYESWARGYYPAFAKGGLIIDVRNNQGGNIDSWIIGRLLRKAWFYWNQRVGRANLWNMQYAFRGHVVVLCNEWTASDGEAFSEAVKRLKLGTVIGTRTWGGEIWLSASNDLLDKGIATSAEMGVFDRTGKWLIEGHGVEPDVVVDNLPHATFKGEDAQLAAAINLLKKKIKEAPVVLPPVPAFPRK